MNTRGDSLTAPSAATGTIGEMTDGPKMPHQFCSAPSVLADSLEIVGLSGGTKASTILTDTAVSRSTSTKPSRSRCRARLDHSHALCSFSGHFYQGVLIGRWPGSFRVHGTLEFDYVSTNTHFRTAESSCMPSIVFMLLKQVAGLVQLHVEITSSRSQLQSLPHRICSRCTLCCGRGIAT